VLRVFKKIRRKRVFCLVDQAITHFFAIGFLVLFTMPICPVARGGTQLVVCSHVKKMTMPTIKEHSDWLANNSRYGSEMAKDFLQTAKPYGDDYLKYQIHFLSEFPGGSGWFDFNGVNGISEADANAKILKKWSCNFDDYPVIVMIGAEPKFLRNNTIYVSPSLGDLAVVSLKHLVPSKHPIAVRLESSNKLLCADVAAGDCEGIPGIAAGANYLPKEFIGKWSAGDGASCAIDFTAKGYTEPYDG
jgi:hypothetical protein